MTDKLIYIIPKEDKAQTLESVKVLPSNIKGHLADRVLSVEEFIHCINVANGNTNKNLAGEYRISPEFQELADEVADCITSGEYFIVMETEDNEITNKLNQEGCYYARPNGEDCIYWSSERINRQLDFCETCDRYATCNNVAYLIDESKKKLDEVLEKYEGA